MTERRARSAALDGLRGVLALTVVAYHIQVWLFDLGLSHFDWHFTQAVGEDCVLAFFVMSAMVLTRAWGRQTFPVFLVKRVVRLWPVFAVCLVVSAISSDRPIAWLWFTFVPIFYQPDVPAWSVGIEARAMLCMPIIVWSGRGSIARSVVLGAIWCFASRWTSASLSGLAFLLGARLARFDVHCVFLERKLPQFLGKISYSLYLCHWEIVRLLTVHAGYWSILLSIPVSIAAAWVLWITVEQPSIAASRMVARAMSRGALGPAHPTGEYVSADQEVLF